MICKAQELWEVIVRLETEKYDLEERQRRQDYDVSNKDRLKDRHTDRQTYSIERTGLRCK